MNPADTTRSGSCAAVASVIAASQASGRGGRPGAPCRRAAPRPRRPPGPAVPVGADRDHPRRVVADRGREQGLQQRTGARGQHHQPRRCARGHTERLLHAMQPNRRLRGSSRGAGVASSSVKKCASGSSSRSIGRRGMAPGRRGSRLGSPAAAVASTRLGLGLGFGLGSVRAPVRRRAARTPVRARARRRGLGARVERSARARRAGRTGAGSRFGVAAIPPVITTVRPPIPTNHRNTAGPNVVWSTPTSPKLPSSPPPA